MSSIQNHKEESPKNAPFALNLIKKHTDNHDDLQENDNNDDLYNTSGENNLLNHIPQDEDNDEDKEFLEYLIDEEQQILKKIEEEERKSQEIGLEIQVSL